MSYFPWEGDWGVLKYNKKTMINPFLNAQLQVKEACNLFGECSNDVSKYEVLSQPKRIIEVNIPVRMDDWNIKTFLGFRAQHNDSRGPFKWWIRFHQDVNRDEVKALSMWMTFKCAIIDIPLWWGKWWIIVNPKELSELELERLARWYVRALYKYLGPEKDVPAPDVNTNPKIMAWMMDEYSELVWKYSPWSFTWKPLEVWGSKWRGAATAQGGVYVLQKILEKQNDVLGWKTFIIQWAWNAWLTMARLLTELWAKLIWISDSKWWIYNEHWLFVDELISLKSSRKSVIEYVDATKLKHKEVLYKKCDILIPAALENQITDSNVEKIKTKLILELANWPITPKADKILFKNWVVVIPDILANAGGVMVSYFEQVQNNANFYWEEDEIDEKLNKKITCAAEQTYNKAKELNSNLRNWAYVIAIKRVLDAMEARWEV